MSEAGSGGLLNNHRYLCKKALMLQSRRVKRKLRQSCRGEPGAWTWTRQLCRSLEAAPSGGGTWFPHSCLPGPGPSGPGLVSAPGDSWEVDSGFSSEASPSASGRSSPCAPGLMVVSLDCEMVGTGPGGCCSELARCSIVDYHGNTLYDKYVQPCGPVTDYRTPWSGIQKHHLLTATPFSEARAEVRLTPTPSSESVWS